MATDPDPGPADKVIRIVLSGLARSFQRRRDAERWHRDQCAARDAGTWVDQRLGRQRLDEWFEEWWSTRTELRPSTVARDESLYRNHVLSRFGDAALSNIDYPLVTAWVASLRDRGLAPATVRRCHLPSVRLPDPEMHRIADSFAVFVLLGGYGGLRFGELAGLRTTKIDTVRRTVRVDTSLIEVRGTLIEGRPKTAAGIRTVPLPRSVAEPLERSTRHLGAEDHVFRGAEGSAIRAGSFRSCFWAPALERADLTGLRMHDLGHPPGLSGQP